MEQIRAQDILTTDHIIKFFDDESFAEKLLKYGEMLFRPIRSFKESTQSGRGDINEGEVKCHFSLYAKEQRNILYNKLGDVTAVRLNVNCPIYCYSQLNGRNLHPNGEFYFSTKALKDFGSGNQTYCAILDRVQFENRILEYCNTNDIPIAISNVIYSDNDIGYEMINQMQLGENPLPYFYKRKIFEEQQERRILIRENIDSLEKRGIGKAFRDGLIIRIGSLSDIGYIGMYNIFH